MNIISELFRLVKKSNSLISNCTAAMIPSSFSIILTKQYTLSVTRSFDSSSEHYYKRSIVTMRLSCNVVKISRLKDNGVTNSTFWGHVTSSVTWPFDSRVSTSYGWSMVTMRISGTVMKIWRLKCWTLGWFYTLSNAMHCIGQTIIK